MAEKRHRRHLKSRKSKAFNTLSKYQEDAAKVAAKIVWETILKKYPKLQFNNFDTLGVKDLDARYALGYINRGLKTKGLPERKEADPSIPQAERPPQAQGNAIERFAKNANAIKTLTSFYGYNPYVVICEGF